MPVILRCDKCRKETVNNFPANRGWMVKPAFGGTEVTCPECKKKEIPYTSISQDLQEGAEKLGKLFEKKRSMEKHISDD